MSRGQRAVKRTTLLAIVAVALSGGLGHAQTVNSARTGSIDLTTRLQYDTNPNLTTGAASGQFSASERLDFSVLTETRSQQFQADGGGAIRYDDANGLTFVRPDIRLRYSMDAKNSDVTARFGYRETDVVGFFDIDPSAATILISDPGTLRTLSGGATVNLAKNAPFTFSASVDHTAVEVRNTIDPTLFDTFDTTVSASAGLRFSGVTQGTLTVSHNIFSADDATQTLTNTTSANFSISHEVKSALTVTGDVGYLRRDLELSGTSTVRDGFRVGVGVDQARPAGNVFGRLTFDRTRPTERSSLTIGGSRQLPAGNLNGSLTASYVPGTGYEFCGSAGYDQQLPDGSFRFNLDQSFQTDQNDNETLTTRFGLGYRKNVTATSNLSVNFNFARIEDAGAGTTPTVDRATLAATYDRAITPDWNMSVGYAHRLLSDAGGRADSDSVFLSLSRNVQFGF